MRVSHSAQLCLPGAPCLSELRDRVSVGMAGFRISSVNMPPAYGCDGIVAQDPGLHQTGSAHCVSV